jgi:hypothetical protein
MDLSALETEINQLQADELAKLKIVIAERERELTNQAHPQTSEQWDKAIQNFLDEFWADTPDNEKDEFIAAIRFKNIPPDK